jgi:hypothetical protein
MLLGLGLVTLLLLGALVPGAARAQADSQLFPETGYTVGGRFLEYWRQNGGLAVFGFPLSNQFSENGLQVQYFERQRFELHPENARPYDVLLGRLGAQLWGPVYAPPESGPRSGCIWFPETRQNVCNQQTSLGFASYWQLNGLEFDGRPNSRSYAESLALFGYPITGLVEYVAPDGTRVQAQWFERARFEWHPANPDAFKVLLGRLGAETKPATPPGPALVDTVNIYLISTGSGTVGCGDELVPVVRRIAPTPAPLQAALAELFALKSQTIGESGLYNALYQSDIRIDRVVIVNGRAEVALSGTVRLNGVCDEPRVEAQIEATVRQFPSVTSTAITLNGVPLADAIR